MNCVALYSFISFCDLDTKEPTMVRNDSSLSQALSQSTTINLPPLPQFPPGIASYSCLYALFEDGLILVTSACLPEPLNECQVAISKILSTVSSEAANILAKTSSQLGAAPKSPKGKRKGKDDDNKAQEELEKQMERERQRQIDDRHKEILDKHKEKEACRNLYLSTPTGLQLSFQHTLASNKDSTTLSWREIFVLKQYHLSKNTKKEMLEDEDTVKEQYRSFAVDGSVIKVRIKPHVYLSICI